LLGLSSANTTALISAAAVVAGILLGGLITAGTTAHFERRRDKADNRQARRLVAEELRSIYNHLSLLQEEGYPVALPESPTFLPTEQWEANRGVLARHLDDKTWDALSPFMDSIPATRAVIGRDVAAGLVVIPSSVLGQIENAHDIALDAYSALTDGVSLIARADEDYD
jgi:hypothetical protein